MTYKEYILSPAWYQIKVDLLALRGCKCEICGKNHTPTRLQVHHLTYERLFKEEPEDLQLLCGKCHMGVHNIGKDGKKQEAPKNKGRNKLVLKKNNKKAKKKKSHGANHRHKKKWEYCPPEKRMAGSKKNGWSGVRVTIEDLMPK